MSSWIAQQRESQLKKNADHLKALDLTVPISKPTPAPKPKSTVPRKRPAPKREVEPRLPTRARSTRSAALPTQHRSEEEIKEIEEQKEKEEQAERDRLRIAKHGPREIEALLGVTGSLDTDQLKAEFATLADYVDVKKEEQQEATPSKRRASAPKRGSSASPKKAVAANLESAKVDTAELKKRIKQVEHRATIKVVPDRIYSLVVHPDLTRDLVFAGDKKGHIGFWDATNAGLVIPSTNGTIRDGAVKAEDEDEEEETEEVADRGKYYHWQGHLSSSVSQLKIGPNEPHKLYSSSYDCTMRCRDFTRDFDEEVLDLDRFDGSESLVHSFDFAPSGSVLYAVDNDGGLTRRDLRQKMETAERWYIDRAKVGCISVNQANENIAVTSHLKKEMKLWDLRKFTSLNQKGSSEDYMEDALIASHTYRNACSSSYFDRTGTKIVSTCYDDYLRIWDVDPFNTAPLAKKFDPVVKIRHDCQVGRYTSIFRAQWINSPLIPLSCTVGNMKRNLTVYSADGTAVAHLSDESITAVPAITASHPTHGEMRMFGGSSSGKISFFRTAET